MSDSKISWTTKTWNPTTGCDRVSPGCDHCYAATLAARLKRMGNPRYRSDGNPKTSGPGFALTLHPDKLEEPLRWRKPATVFVNSMSDLFHEKVPEEFIVEVFAVMALASHHTFQVLTKRPRRMATLLGDRNIYGTLASTFEARVGRRAMHIARERGENVSDAWWDAFWDWPLPNVWLGTSVENQRWADQRIPLLLQTLAAVRFLSCEPLLGPIDLRCAGAAKVAGGRLGIDYLAKDAMHVDWVIVGGESGPEHRPLNLDWARSLRDQCVAAGVPFFYKQGSGIRSEMHKELDGRAWSEMPDDIATKTFSGNVT